jgi:hypothetical protein
LLISLANAHGAGALSSFFFGGLFLVGVPPALGRARHWVCCRGCCGFVTAFAEAQAQFTRATHTAEIGNLYYTASNPAANPAGMTNRAPRGKRNNARLAKPSAVKARDPIPAGREILLAYGSDYNI